MDDNVKNAVFILSFLHHASVKFEMVSVDFNNKK